MTTIRPIELDDAPAVYAAVDASRDALARWMGWCHPGYSLADATAWVERSVAERGAGAGYQFAICDDQGDLVGVLGVEDVSPTRAWAMLGYWIATPATGRGHATRAVAQGLAWVARHTHITTLRAHVAPANAASRRVVEANGFRIGETDAVAAASGQLVYELHRRGVSAAATRAAD